MARKSTHKKVQSEWRKLLEKRKPKAKKSKKLSTHKRVQKEWSKRLGRKK